MPLVHGKSEKAFKQNVRTLTKEIGTSPHVQSRKQALAISFAEKRRARADGGAVFEGPIVSTVPGRTDKHAMDVPSGAYFLPAETISHLGQNNTLAGLKKADEMFGPNSKHAVQGQRYMAKGGKVSSHIGSATPVNGAGGEYVISPAVVLAIGHGDIKKGHQWLDRWVLAQRKKHIKTLRGLAPPAKD